MSASSAATLTCRKITNTQQATERRERTVYVFDIPPGSQEGLLQQALEKHYPVRRVELFAHKGQARVELKSAKDAGALLLHSDKLEFNGAVLRVQDHPEAKAAPAKPAAAMAASTSKEAASSLAFGPRPRKVGKAMGQAYRPPRAAAATAAAAPTGGSGQDAFRAFMNTTNEARKKADEEARAKAEADKAKREAERQRAEADKKRALEDGEDSEPKRAKREGGEEDA